MTDQIDGSLCRCRNDHIDKLKQGLCNRHQMEMGHQGRNSVFGFMTDTLHRVTSLSTPTKSSDCQAQTKPDSQWSGRSCRRVKQTDTFRAADSPEIESSKPTYRTGDKHKTKLSWTSITQPFPRFQASDTFVIQIAVEHGLKLGKHQVKLRKGKNG